MIERIAEIVSEKIIVYNHNSDDKDIYIYGLQIILNTLISICAVLLLGAFFHEFTGAVLFLISYCSVRLFAGGLHASTNNRCMMIFISGYIITYLILKNLVIHFNPVVLCFLILLNCMILLWAPVDALNNPISDKFRGSMKKRAFFISLFFSTAVSLLLYHKYEAGKWAFAGLCWVSLILVTGKINNILISRGNYHHEKVQ